MTLPDSLTVALVRATHHGPDADEHLRADLTAARERGATLAVLPEIPADPWWPATDEVRDEACEPDSHEGPRRARTSAAAKDVGMAVLGGAIVRRADGRRFNTALAVDATGRLVGTYAKSHIPDEPGFREAAHYLPGEEPPRVLEDLAPGVPLGVQICSDTQRAFGIELLSALGAVLILHPRATEAATWSRWRTTLASRALTSSTWIVSVNRPPEPGADAVGLGGPGAVFDPRGELVFESEDRVSVFTLDPRAALEARVDYPGYLAWRPELYAAGWSAASGR